MLSFIKFCWKALCFIRDLVMNVVFLFFVLLLAAIIGLSSAGKKTAVMPQEGALLLNLDGYLADNGEENFVWQDALRELNNQRVPLKMSTFDVANAINIAARDPQIKGLVLDLNHFEGADLPALDYLGKTIIRFKAENKPVIAYADYYSQGQYYLASFADEIYMNPIGQVSIEGMKQENLYFKAMLDKLAVTPHIFRVGTYKSAVEPFLRNDMSAEAKSNLSRWLNAMWANYVETVSANRTIEPNTLLPKASQYIADLKALKGDTSAYSLKRQLVTNVATRLEVSEKLTALFGKNAQGEPNLIAFEDYLMQFEDRFSRGENAHKIAVVNVEGAIIDGDSDDESVGGDSIARLLRQAANDDAVKAVVLRVNSPGGSAFASEMIRQETENLQKKGKPVVVSMGSMAASGGYWIASTADYIVADKNTITGSIGIFAMFPTFENSLKQIGVNADGVATTDLTGGSVLSPLSKSMQDIYQLEIEHGYQQFLNIVSRGRDLSTKQVDNLAQGQIWLGQEAYQKGLVDELGDIESAILHAEKLANLHLGDREAAPEYDIFWLKEENNSWFNTVLNNSRKTTQSALSQWIGLPAPVWQVKQELNLLSRFNDPKGQYLYCLNCGKVR